MVEKRILIIEDERSIAELQRDYLEIQGFSVELEHRGDLGLEKALRNDYDLIILDLMLPNMDGYEVCRQLRKEKDVPIMMISARKEDIDIIRGLGLGVDDYMIKPFSPSEMVARVKAHLTRVERLLGGAKTNKDRIRIRGLTIDPSSRRTYLNNREIHLTLKEFELLVYLARHADRVFSKEDLFEQVWGMDAAGEVATVTVHIGKLREKLGEDIDGCQYIETVWGVGYRFKA